MCSKQICLLMPPNILPNIPTDNRALTKLDISNNNIRQGGLISEVCNTRSIELDNHESESDCDY